MTKVLVLTTAARLRADWVAELRAELPWDDPDIAVVAVTRPSEPLPVRRCLVVGPSVRWGRAVRDVRVQGAGRPAQRPRRKAAEWADRFVDLLLPRSRSKDRRIMLSSGTRWSRAVAAEFTAADFVVAHDFNATWAAWQLARRFPGPQVVFQMEGVRLKVAELAASGTTY